MAICDSLPLSGAGSSRPAKPSYKFTLTR